MKHDPRKAILHSVNALVGAVTDLIAAMGSAASSAITHVAPRGRVGRPPKNASRPVGRPPAKGSKSAKLKKSIKAHWDAMSPGQRKSRIKKMLAARGLKPKPKSNKPPSKKSLALKKSIKAHWAAMSDSERAARVRTMQAGRGLQPKA